MLKKSEAPQVPPKVTINIYTKYFKCFYKWDFLFFNFFSEDTKEEKNNTINKREIHTKWATWNEYLRHKDVARDSIAIYDNSVRLTCRKCGRRSLVIYCRRSLVMWHELPWITWKQKTHFRDEGNGAERKSKQKCIC